MSDLVAAASDEDWPASAQALEQARSLIMRAHPGRVVIACDHDVDGLASAVLVMRALGRLAVRWKGRASPPPA